MPLSALDGSRAMLGGSTTPDLADRAAFNDAAVRGAGGFTNWATNDPMAFARFEGEGAVKKRRERSAAGITPEMEQALLQAMSAGGRQPGEVGLGAGFDRYRTEAALDLMARGQFDPSRWGLS